MELDPTYNIYFTGDIKQMLKELGTDKAKEIALHGGGGIQVKNERDATLESILVAKSRIKYDTYANGVSLSQAYSIVGAASASVHGRSTNVAKSASGHKTATRIALCMADERIPVNAKMVISVMSMWTRVLPTYAANMWNEALNKRLDTEELGLYGILTETERRGLSFDQLLTIPEQDEWIYSDGKSTTCVAFILAMYKEAGVFGTNSDSIQDTEFTIRDAYMLKIFENNQTLVPKWCNSGDDKLPFCQILGEYRMELPQYNTLEPYANMNENCPSLPPTYERPIHC